MLLDAAIQNPSSVTEKILAQWIAANSTGVENMTPISTESTKAAGIIREDPPKEQYDKFKYELTDARTSSDYLDELIDKGGTKVEIEKLFE